MTRQTIAPILTTVVALSVSVWATPAHAQTTASPPDLVTLFRRLDIDGDGQLSKVEFKKLAGLGQRKFRDRPEVFERVFDRLDSDQSGMLSQSEFNELPRLGGSAQPPPLSPTASPSSVPSPDASKDDTQEIERQPLEIGTVPELVLHDANRNKDLRVRINYPKTGGPFPLIVFSHGAWGSKDGHVALTELWASNGYVTIQPDHSDSRALGVKVGDTSVFRAWQERPADVSFILDSLAEIETKVPALKGKLDAGRIGMIGHSYGANTAQLIGGARAFLAGREMSFEDSRVDAVVMLSGQGPGEMLTEKSWEHFTKPLLVMTGSRDGPTRTGQPAAWRKQPYELSPPGDKYLVWVEGMDHGFGGISGLEGRYQFQTNAVHVRYSKIITLTFWDAFLKGNTEALAYLKSDQLPKSSGGTLKLDHK